MAPPTVIIDHREHVLFIHGEVTPFISFPTGELSTHIADMTRSPLRAPVRAVLRQASLTHAAASVEVPLSSDGGALWVRVTAASLKSSRVGRTMRVSFEMKPAPEWSVSRSDAGAAPSAAPLVLPLDPELEDEVRGLRRELQNSVEAFEASNEELRSSNEEVLSVNEELQSANEELETGKEEAQSINKELITLNSQLQGKITELEQTTNDLTNLLSSTSIAVVFLDTQLLVRRFTPAVHDLIELIPSDVGRPIHALSPKFSPVQGKASSHEVLREAAHAVLENLTPLETEVLSHSGKWYLQRTLPYRTSDNRIAGVVVTFVDITRRRQAERALAQVQERLETALEHAAAAIMIVETSTSRVLHANRLAAELFGQAYPPPFLNMRWEAAVMAMKGWDREGRLLKPDQWPLARSLQSGKSIAGEQVEIDVDGVRRVWSVSSAIVSNDLAEAIAVVATFWDITDLKAAEQAARDSERRLQLILDSAQDFAILMLDTSGLITAWSSGAASTFGWSESEIIGQSMKLIFTAADQDAGVPEREMRTALKDGHALDERWLLRKEGTTFWANGVLSVARDEANNVQGFVKILRDNTARKQAEDQLIALTQASVTAQTHAEAANQAKDDFISMVSHELRTPLHTMRMWMGLMRKRAIPPQDWLEGGRVLENAVEAQERLIDDLLDVARISAGKLRLEIRPTRLADAIGAAVETVRPVSDRKGVLITYRPSPAVGVVRADPDRIQQVVWNLLSNAVKFTPSRGEAKIELERETDSVVIIRVTDTGIGIGNELLPEIFKRFQQGESGTARAHTGLGLGLDISKQLVDLHGGSITATSEGTGKGACFVVRLPLKDERMDLDAPSPPRAGDTLALTRLRILLVEDEGSTRDATRRVLESAQAQVQAVESAAAGREAYALQRPDIIVSDIGMPGEDGYVLMQQVRAFEKEQGLSRVPALALTAFARQEDRQLCMEAGYDSHMAKPVEPDYLLRKIAQLTGRQAS